MTFEEALKKLNIEDYREKIFNSNSKGELFHLSDYIKIAEMPGDGSWFREFFQTQIEHTKENWDRPESVYQHMLEILNKYIADWRANR
jgi:hypothetical protein